MGLLPQILRLTLSPSQLRPILQWFVLKNFQCMELSVDFCRKLWHEPVHRRNLEKESPALRECFKYLSLTSRSFSSVIQELNPELLISVTLFYLILRGLDTIEDDMTIPIEEKEPLLRNFHEVLKLREWNFDGNGPLEKDRELLVHFDVVTTEFALIKSVYQTIITDITKKMGNGMADYALNSEHNSNGVNTIEDYELYCHYVAGLVGDGLTRIFVESGLANPALLQRPHLTESMGQFLQKTNIIRDVREDFDDGRRFWPKEIWSRHVEKFDDLFKSDHLQKALNCSSEMVMQSLCHADECLFYMAGIKDQSVFNFVAIPQAMAIATLELVFQNPKIFVTNVKITKGDACQLMIESSQNLRSVCGIFKRYARRIHKKNSPRDPNFVEISLACAKDSNVLSRVYTDEQTKDIVQASEAKKDVFYIMLAVFGTLAVISAAMIGAAYIVSARFGITFDGLQRGTKESQALPTRIHRSEL